MLRIKGCAGLFIDTLLIMTAVITNHIEITPGICGGREHQKINYLILWDGHPARP